MLMKKRFNLSGKIRWLLAAIIIPAAAALAVVDLMMILTMRKARESRFVEPRDCGCRNLFNGLQDHPVGMADDVPGSPASFAYQPDLM